MRVQRLMLDLFLESGQTPAEYLDSIAIHKSGKRAVWDSFGLKWRESDEVQGYEIEEGYVVGKENYELLLKLFSMIKVLDGEVMIEKYDFMEHYPKFEYMLQSKKKYVEVKDRSWREVNELAIFGNKPEQDKWLKGKVIHTNCQELANRFNQGLTEIMKLVFYTTDTQQYYSLMLEKESLDLPYDIRQGTPRRKDTLVFVSKETQYLRYQMEAWTRQGSNVYLEYERGEILE